MEDPNTPGSPWSDVDWQFQSYAELAASLGVAEKASPETAATTIERNFEKVQEARRLGRTQRECAEVISKDPKCASTPAALARAIRRRNEFKPWILPQQTLRQSSSAAGATSPRFHPSNRSAGLVDNTFAEEDTL